MKKYIGILLFFGLLLALNTGHLAMAKDGESGGSGSGNSGSSVESSDSNDDSSVDSDNESEVEDESEAEDQNEAEVEDEPEVRRAPGAISPLRQEMRANREAAKEEFKANREARKEEFKANREALKADWEAKKEAFKAEKEAWQEKIKTEREAFVSQLKTEKEKFVAELKAQKEAWKEVKEEKKAEFCVKAQEMFSVKFSTAIAKLGEFQTRVGGIIEKLNAEGRDTSLASQALETSKSKLAEAQAKLDGIKSSVPTDTCESMTADVFEQIKLQAREAKDLLKESKNYLHDSIKELKILRGEPTEDESATEDSATTESESSTTSETPTN